MVIQKMARVQYGVPTHGFDNAHRAPRGTVEIPGGGGGHPAFGDFGLAVIATSMAFAPVLHVAGPQQKLSRNLEPRPPGRRRAP